MYEYISHIPEEPGRELKKEYAYLLGSKKFGILSMVNKEIIQTAPLRYGYVVQGNSGLFEENASSGMAVVLFSTDKAYSKDVDLLARVGENIMELMDRGVSEDPGEITVIKSLNNHTEFFQGVDVPDSLTEGKPFKLSVLYVYSSELVDRKMPENRIIPVFYFPKTYELRMLTYNHYVNKYVNKIKYKNQ